MHTRSRYTSAAFGVCLSLLVTAVLPAQVLSPTVSLEILPASTRPQDGNFKVGGTFGFSVVNTNSDDYYLYATTYDQRFKWNQAKTETQDLYFFDRSAYCPMDVDPRYWAGSNSGQNGRCIDAIGLFTKKISCSSGSPCENEGTWNADPGFKNITAAPLTYPWFTWPKTTDYGVAGFTPILDKDQINNAISQPTSTGDEEYCHPHNPGGYATGAANSKVVLVYYTGGVHRWYMAFNKMIHSETSNSQDKWQIAWAYSDDGRDWTVHSPVLFRSTREGNQDAFCGEGLLVNDMTIDNGWFYMIFTENTQRQYLVRSWIGPFDPDGPGFKNGWQVAKKQGTQWTWNNVNLGVQTDWSTAGTVIFPNVPGPFNTRQAAIARVFTSSAPNSPSRYIALASDVNSAGQPLLKVYSATSLSAPTFVEQSDVDISGISVGQFGLEFAFTQYTNNYEASPRIVNDQLDLWFVQYFENPNPSVLQDAIPHVTVSRRTAKITGGIFGN